MFGKPCLTAPFLLPLLVLLNEDTYRLLSSHSRAVLVFYSKPRVHRDCHCKLCYSDNVLVLVSAAVDVSFGVSMTFQRRSDVLVTKQ